MVMRMVCMAAVLMLLLRRLFGKPLLYCGEIDGDLVIPWLFILDSLLCGTQMLLLRMVLCFFFHAVNPSVRKRGVLKSFPLAFFLFLAAGKRKSRLKEHASRNGHMRFLAYPHAFFTKEKNRGSRRARLSSSGMGVSRSYLPRTRRTFPESISPSSLS